MKLATTTCIANEKGIAYHQFVNTRPLHIRIPSILGILKPNPVQRCLSISFPRSGHGLLARCLDQYFRSSFRKQVFHYCEYYHHCQTLTCQKRNTNFQKIHDDVTVNATDAPDWMHLIQYREQPLESIVSLFCLRTTPGRKHGKPLEDSRKEWESFALSTADRWNRFVQTWLNQHTNRPTAYISYEELLQNPKNTLTRVILFLAPDHDVDVHALDHIIHNNDIRKQNDIRQFKYFDDTFFQELEHTLVPAPTHIASTQTQ